MNLQSKYPTTPDEFLRWNEGREGKREFVNGRVIEMMINVTRNHWLICNRLIRQLAGQLDVFQYDVGGADFGVRTADGIRFPDVMVEASGGEGKALATETPLMLAEVLSPSSTTDDFGPKARDYLQLESLRYYLVAAQAEFRIWLWRRGADGEWGKAEPIETDYFELSFGSAVVTISLAEVYAGIASQALTS